MLRQIAFSIIIAVSICSFANAQNNKEKKSASLAVKTKQVFKNLEINRPVLIENAGDGSKRLFIASQLGKIFMIDATQSEPEPQLFMDIEDRVIYRDRKNEEGLLGLAFDPNFKTNQTFYVYYSTKSESQTSIISRFKAKDGKGDPGSEEQIMKIKQPFWNHNGGTILFGPKGYLYVGLGDGGAANDPQGNGQNLKTLLGSILRIDVNKKDEGKAYAIPADNPFVDKENARPEIYAYGLRNIWRMAFDSKTDLLYGADVGQNIWEEINIIESGGNYGWNVREAKHKFGPNGQEASDKFIEPIWEYHHSIGKSITGGHVYRGKNVPALDGVYLFADYVSGFVWGIKYDQTKKKVTDHYTISGPHRTSDTEAAPIITFGQDEAGEVYFSDVFGRFFTFEKSEK